MPGQLSFAVALGTPIAVSLARIIYSEPGTDPAELLSPDVFPDVYSIVDHLIDEFCKTVYCRPPLDKKDQRRQFSCSLTQARKWLGCLATVLHAHETYDLPAYVMSGFGVQFKDAWRFVLRGQDTIGIPAATTSLWRNRLLKERGALRERLVDSLIPGTKLFVFFAAFEALVSVLAHPPVNNLDKLWCALLIGLLMMGILIVIAAFATPIDYLVNDENLDVPIVRTPRRELVLLAVTLTFVYPTIHLLVYWLVLRRLDIPFALIFLILTPFALGFIFVPGLAFGGWSPKLTRGRLIRRRQIPRRTIAFLEDAYKRGVLRKVGATYQFRHAILQDRFAEQWLASRRPWVRRRRPMLYARYNLAEVWASVGRPEKAEVELRTALAQSRRALHRGDFRPLWAWYVLTQALEDQDKAASARDELRQLLAVARRTSGGDAHWLTRYVWKALCTNLLRARSAEARSTLTEFREALQATGSQHEGVKADMAWAQRRLAKLERSQRELHAVLKWFGPLENRRIAGS